VLQNIVIWITTHRNRVGIETFGEKQIRAD